jgi:two-component system response regulator NreC
MKWRVFVADDHTIVRKGIVLLIETQADMEVVGEAGDGESAWRQIRELLPDVAIVDISLPILNGAQLAERLRDQCPSVKVLALSAYSDSVHIQALIGAGAKAYIHKRAAADELTSAIREIANGAKIHDSIVSNDSRELAAEQHLNGVLSSRDIEIIKMVVWGHSNKDIADRLHLSIKTIEGYKAKIMEKLQLSNRVELVRYALRKGWMEEV